MPTPKLLRLKAEVVAAASGPNASAQPYVQVRVDTGVFHLDGLYDYIVPEKFSPEVQIGVRVQIPFGTRQVEGIVVNRIDNATRSGQIKVLTKVLSPHPIATKASLELIDCISQKFACNPWEIIRSAIPPRVANVDKTFKSAPQPSKTNRRNSEEFVQLVPFVEPHAQVADYISSVQPDGSVLVVAPDESDVDRIIANLIRCNFPVLKLTSAMSREERYRNYLLAMNTDKCVVVGTRSAVFAPVSGLSTIIVFRESSIDHFEVRSPGWNSKSIAQERVQLEGINFLMLGFSPSLEVAQQIDARKIRYVSTRSEVKVKAYTPIFGELLPDRIFLEIREALKSGPVLFLAARKGYGNALICAHCRNIATCDCGGRLSVTAKNQAPSCVHCGQVFTQWRCIFCQRDKQYLAGRGIDRAAEEIVRAFPNIPVVISAGELIKTEIDPKASLVLATPGAQPFVAGGYEAAVVLDGIRFFSHTDLRTSERARETFFETAALIKSTGKVLLVIDDVHPIVAAIARWNIGPLLKRELKERVDVNLPPLVDSALLIVDDTEASTLARGLRAAQSDGRLPQSIQILGPTSVGKEKSKIVVLFLHYDGEVMRQFLLQLQRKRSIARKPLLTLRLTPYSL